MSKIENNEDNQSINVKTEQWKIIKRVDMEPEAQADKLQVCQLSLAAA